MSINMRDADSGRLIWQSAKWDQAFTQETQSTHARSLHTQPALCHYSLPASELTNRHCSLTRFFVLPALPSLLLRLRVDLSVHVPASLLSLHAISREMVFHSRHSMSAFRLTQSILFHSHLIEHWSFTFGFVIPDSSNSWQCVIAKGEESASQPQLSAQQLSGNVVIETRFWDGEQLLGISRIRVHYDGPE